jgi:hypothetical protein
VSSQSIPAIQQAGPPRHPSSTSFLGILPLNPPLLLRKHALYTPYLRSLIHPIGIVFEDAPSGIKSGVASGAKVLAVCTSHERSQVEGMGATWIVTDLSKSVPRSLSTDTDIPQSDYFDKGWLNSP